MNRILIIDNDEVLCSSMREYLRKEDFELVHISHGELGSIKLQERSVCLVILNIHLPNFNGLELLREFRRQSDLPVLILTASDDPIDRILGLEFGADDYLNKPFERGELLAHLRSILRRLEGSEKSSNLSPLLVNGELRMDTQARTLKVRGESIDLTHTEFNLLACLLKEPGRILERENLMPAILGRPFDPWDRSIDTHISKLRRKIGKGPDGLEQIKTVRGIGYCLINHPSGAALVE